MKGERFISLKVLLHRESTISPRLTDKGSSSPTTAGTHVVGFLPHWIRHPRDHRQLVTPLGIWPVGDLWKYVDASDLAERETWLQLQQCDGTMW